MKEPGNASSAADRNSILRLAHRLQRHAPRDAVTYLQDVDDASAARVLSALPTTFATQVLLRLSEKRRNGITPLLDSEMGEQWTQNQQYPEYSVGRLMSKPTGVLEVGLTAREAIEKVRQWTHEIPVTYGYAVDAQGKLLGLVVMRDLMLAEPQTPLRSVMIGDPFCFNPETRITEAMHDAIYRQYPAYPVCDAQGVLIGVVAGYMLFEQQNFRLSTQAGSMVGVDKEERYATPWRRCLLMRMPWLQFNLFTAFLAALVVGLFENTIAQLVVLAVFLPVLAGQSGNTGCQALAVTLRGLALGEYGDGAMRRLLQKETLLGLLNGLAVGLVAAAAMVGYAWLTEAPNAWMLGLIMLLAMTGSCVASGITGVLVPLTLHRLGIDPATASSIFLTTATDVFSLGMFLGFATLMVL